MKNLKLDLTLPIVAVIKEFSERNENFTVFNITSQLRIEMPSYIIDDNKVRSLVHEIMSTNKDYTLVDSGNFSSYEKNIAVISATTIQGAINELSDNNDGISVTDSSSWVGEKSYMQKSEILILALNDVVYLYRNVPKEVYVNFRKSSSRGQYFNKNIRGKFERIKLDEAFDCVGVN
jgi:hypothetical protein